MNLPPAEEIYICSYECTFCCDCASQAHNRCPFCGGELTRRPQRKMLNAVADADAATPSAERPWLIWAVSFGVWIFIAIASAISMYAVQRSLGRSTTFRSELILPLIQSLIFALLTPFVFRFAMRYPVQRENWMPRSGLHLVGALTFAGAHSIIRGMVYPVWDPDARNFAWALWNSQSHALRIKWTLFERLLLYNTVDHIYSAYLPIVLIAFGISYYKRFRERELRAAELEGQLAKAHLHELKSQLQPHFLFNTLHSISALMHTDVRAADKMMTRLSDLLRLSLENTGVQVTTLAKELEFLGVYLEIEKIRFGDRLNVRMEIPSNLLDVEVPHLLLQPLVENAIRHGVSRRSADGEVRIRVTREDKDLCLQVRDNGPGLKDAPPQPGRGLEATRERLRTLYGNDQDIEIKSVPEKGVEVNVRIPFFEPPRLLELLPDIRDPGMSATG
jgi:two-component system, LytTR family, sensor kinase